MTGRSVYDIVLDTLTGQGIGDVSAHAAKIDEALHDAGYREPLARGGVLPPPCPFCVERAEMGRVYRVDLGRCPLHEVPAEDRDPVDRLIGYVWQVLSDPKYGHDLAWVRMNLGHRHLAELVKQYGYTAVGSAEGGGARAS